MLILYYLCVCSMAARKGIELKKVEDNCGHAVNNRVKAVDEQLVARVIPLT